LISKTAREFDKRKRLNNRTRSFGLFIVILAATLSMDQVQAETGKGEDFSSYNDYI
jgi:hypothetical protein